MMGRRSLIATVAAIVALAFGVHAGADDVEGEIMGGSGSREMAVKSASGGAIERIEMGHEGTAPFMVAVSDDFYGHSGYEVSMSVSNFYRVNGGGFDCNDVVPSGQFALNFAVEPTTVYDVRGHSAPTWDLSGTLTGALATLLGVADPTPVSAADVPSDVVAEILAGLHGGGENTLPVTAAAGGGGAFANAAPHADCDPGGSGSPTVRTILSGSKNTAGTVFDWIKAAIEDGIATAKDLVDEGVVSDATMNQRVREALQAAGVDLSLLDSLLNLGTLTMNQIYEILAATINDLTSLAGVSGSYVAIPTLSGTVGDLVPFGTYRGTVTVTIADVG